MKQAKHINPLPGLGQPRMRRFLVQDSGATLVEFAIVLSLFLFIFFGLIDYGRLGFSIVMGEKATQMAARIAVVRPAVCAGVPDIHTRGTVPNGTEPPRFGSSCDSGATVCASAGTITCTGVDTNPTAVEIWAAVGDLLPVNATIANLQFT